VGDAPDGGDVADAPDSGDRDADGISDATDTGAGDDAGQSHAVALVRRAGGESVVEVGPDEAVLEAAERTGLGLPFGCRRGACATCTGRLLAGDVTHRREPRALKARHLRDGYVLTCIAVPQSDCRIEVGADVGSDLVENPWR